MKVERVKNQVNKGGRKGRTMRNETCETEKWKDVGGQNETKGERKNNLKRHRKSR